MRCQVARKDRKVEPSPFGTSERGNRRHGSEHQRDRGITTECARLQVSGRGCEESAIGELPGVGAIARSGEQDLIRRVSVVSIIATTQILRAVCLAPRCIS